MTASLEGRNDAARTLTPEGLKRTRQVARALAEKIDSIDTILHSPYVRARETAEIFAAAFPGAKLKEAPGLRPHDEPASALENLDDLHGRVMLVGHEPHMGMLASLLLTGGLDAIMPFKKAGIAGFEWGGAGRSRLMFFLTPRFIL